MAEHQPLYPEDPARGPVILGTPWNCPEDLVLTAASLATALDLHLICAFVDPASYLVEWTPQPDLLGMSLDPVVNEEAAYPSAEVLRRLQAILGPTESEWSFRVLNGGVGPALCRLVDSAGAQMIIIGGSRPGLLPKLGRALEGSIAQFLEHSQHRPIVIVPLRTPRHTNMPRSGK